MVVEVLNKRRGEAIILPLFLNFQREEPEGTVAKNSCIDSSASDTVE